MQRYFVNFRILFKSKQNILFASLFLEIDLQLILQFDSGVQLPLNTHPIQISNEFGSGKEEVIRRSFSPFYHDFARFSELID